MGATVRCRLIDTTNIHEQIRTYKEQGVKQIKKDYNEPRVDYVENKTSRRAAGCWAKYVGIFISISCIVGERCPLSWVCDAVTRRNK